MAKLWEDAARGDRRVLMNVVNAGEVYYLTARKRGLDAAGMVLTGLRKRSLQFVPAPESLVIEAAKLKARYPIAYGDAFAVATAMRRRCPLATGDPELRPLEADGLVELEWAG